MTQALVAVVLFMAAMAALPWLVRKLQQRQSAGAVGSVGSAKVLSAVAVGPHQRVVTVEVGPEGARTCLVLGVTAQQISCLHVLPANPGGFAHALQRETRSAAAPTPTPSPDASHAA